MALFVVAIIHFSLILYGVEVSGRNISIEESTENIFNKQNIIKIIQPIIDPHDFDCVDFHKQPAFAHPKLKNHKIQMEPSFLENLKKNRKTSKFSFEGEACPPGKVPIKRMNVSYDKDDITFRSYNQTFHEFTEYSPGQHYAIMDTLGEQIIHGGQALICVYSLALKKYQISAAQIWLQNGDGSQLNSVQAGWAVHPALYGDSVTRLTIYWTRDNYQRTGCYNLNCPGFVQTSRNAYPGISFGVSSVIGGRQVGFDLSIRQDSKTGNWWLIFMNKALGYWPREIFTSLSREANVVRYGGWTFNSPDGVNPPMGNGNKAGRNFTKSAFFSEIGYLNLQYRVLDITYADRRMFFDQPSCYDAMTFGSHDFTYGGPGGNNCGI